MAASTQRNRCRACLTVMTAQERNSLVCRRCAAESLHAMRVLPKLRTDPTGRIDLLLIRLAEACVRWGEQQVQTRFGLDVKVWDGREGLKRVLETKVQEMGFSEPLPMTPEALARHLGFIGGKLKKVS